MSKVTIEDLYNHGVEEIIPEDTFKKKLNEGEKLRIKMGFDPTKPDLHLGHVVGLKLLKMLQDEGHQIIFLIGDYTTKIGDPSGRNTTRPVITDKEIKENAKTYFKQVGKILDTKKVEIQYNSKWYNKMNFADIIKLAGNFTVAQIIERDDFAKRITENRDIYFHEMLYPIMQAYDSVVLKADVEFGGTDQKFNMLAGRDLQKKMGQSPQDVITVKLLVGLDGKNKMSKSLDNYIALNDTASDMYGKVMSIPDNQILNYFTLCTEITDDALTLIKEELGKESTNPRDIKAELARSITGLYHAKEDTIAAENNFNKVFRDKENPEVIQEIKTDLAESRLDDLLVKLNITPSKSEARRLAEQGGVTIDSEKITNPTENIVLHDGMIIKTGKRNFVKLIK